MKHITRRFSGLLLLGASWLGPASHAHEGYHSSPDPAAIQAQFHSEAAPASAHEPAADVVPPFLVEIAWPAVFQIYILFGLMFVVALVALALILRRMRIFQAIKLGETV